MDTEEGHILPSFGVARSLKDLGHTILYLSILDNEDMVRGQGFEFRSMFEGLYGPGYRSRYKNLSPAGGVGRPIGGSLQQGYNEHIAQLMGGAYDNFLNDLQADLFIVSAFLRTDILILYYKYRIRPVIFTTFLHRRGGSTTDDYLFYLGSTAPEELNAFVEFVLGLGINITTMAELVEPLNSLCEVVVCPSEFEIDGCARQGNVHYLGPSIREEPDRPGVLAELNIPPDAKLIYASLGTQAMRHGNAGADLFTKLIRVMKEDALQDFHLILSVGPEFDINGLLPVPGNVTVARWVPQIAILKRAVLAIIHGGLGSVKECIYYGVPMMVFPLGLDQPWNAERIDHHRLGLTGDIRKITEAELRSGIHEIIENTEIRNNIARMRDIFRAKEESRLAGPLIESLLAGKELRQ